MLRNRSVGLTILGIFFILFGLLSFGPIFLLPSMSKNLPLLVYVALYGLVMFITGIGILRLKSWARIIALVLIVIKMVQVGAGTIVDINTMIRKSAGFGAVFGGIVVMVVGILVSIGLIYYLTRPSVKEQFGG